MLVTTFERANEVLAYWFDGNFPNWALDEGVEKETMQRWFNGGPILDAEIKAKFGADLEAINRGDYDDWLQEDLSCLAGIIIMDQFSRNAYRGTPQMFAMDTKGREWASQLICRPAYHELPAAAKLFVVLPFAHTETLEGQQKCIEFLEKDARLCEERFGPTAGSLKFLRASLVNAKQHHDVMERWGRYPHRNKILGRASTAEEEAGLADGTIPVF